MHPPLAFVPHPSLEIPSALVGLGFLCHPASPYGVGHSLLVLPIDIDPDAKVFIVIR